MSFGGIYWEMNGWGRGFQVTNFRESGVTVFETQGFCGDHFGRGIGEFLREILGKILPGILFLFLIPQMSAPNSPF